MAQEYCNVQKAADMLGVTPAEVNRLREQNKLHGYRDGADWKFKIEDVQNALAERIKAGNGPSPEEPPKETDQPVDDVLLSEVELGESDPTASGTVIGHDAAAGAAGDSDIQLATDSDVSLGSDLDLVADSDLGVAPGGSGSDLEIDLSLDEAADDSGVSLSEDETQVTEEGTGASSIELGAEGEGLEDDDLVLGGSGSGSDITIGGDSGISLVDPHDSGLSLDEPIELGGADESLELGEDDMLTLSEEADSESPTELKTDDDFLLTPLDEAADEESESGSQVIALDDAEEAGAMAGVGPGMAAMLDEEAGPDAAMGMAPGIPPGAMAPAAMAPEAMAMAPVGAMAPADQVALPEAPFGALWVLLMGLLVIPLLILCGIMAHDLIRNMWSWNGPYEVNSSIMDTILGLFGGS